MKKQKTEDLFELADYRRQHGITKQTRVVSRGEFNGYLDDGRFIDGPWEGPPKLEYHRGTTPPRIAYGILDTKVMVVTQIHPGLAFNPIDRWGLIHVYYLKSSFKPCGMIPLIHPRDSANYPKYNFNDIVHRVYYLY